MGDWALLLAAAGAFVGSLGAAAAQVITAVRSSPREREQAAKGAVGKLAEAAQDGEITAEELQQVLDQMREEGS